MNTLVVSVPKFDVGDNIAFKGPNGAVVRCTILNVSFTMGDVPEVYYHVREEKAEIDHVISQKDILISEYNNKPMFSIGDKVAYKNDEDITKTGAIKEVHIYYTKYVDKKSKEAYDTYDIEYTLDTGDEVFEDEIEGVA